MTSFKAHDQEILSKGREEAIEQIKSGSMNTRETEMQIT